MSGSVGRDNTILLITQVYVPDPASVGQHMAGAASELVRRGFRVVVLTSARGYEDPSRVYPSYEVLDGVEVRRLPLASFGKSSLWARLIGGLSFVVQAIAQGMMVRGLRTVVISTSPPMAPLAALTLAFVRKIRVTYWIMDLNPDQAVALGVLPADAVSVRMLGWLNKRLLARADDVVVLDRFMENRVLAKVKDVAPRLHVLPPWPLDDVAEPVAHESNAFRARHQLGGHFVVMYSGNHSAANPLSTLLAAARRLEDDETLKFVFVGGGEGKREVDARPAPNIRSLPYEPAHRLRESLSAADLHVVSIGDAVVGIVHPCKVYGAMAVARPILLFGPAENHVADLVQEHRIGWHVTHGDVDRTIAVLREARAMPDEALADMGRRAQEAIAEQLSRESLTARFCDVVSGSS